MISYGFVSLPFASHIYKRTVLYNIKGHDNHDKFYVLQFCHVIKAHARISVKWATSLSKKTPKEIVPWSQSSFCKQRFLTIFLDFNKGFLKNLLVQNSFGRISILRLLDYLQEVGLSRVSTHNHPGHVLVTIRILLWVQ